MRSWFLFVDLQQDFLSEPGLEPHRNAVIAGAAELLREARRRGSLITHIHTGLAPAPDQDRRMRHWKIAGRRSCVTGTAGHQPPPELAPLPGETVLGKTGFGVGGETLARVAAETGVGTSAIVAGVHTHACVRQAALDLNEAGFAVTIARDAIGSHDPWQAAQAEIYLRRRFIAFLATTEILARLDAGRSGDGFREDIDAAPALAARRARLPGATLEQRARVLEAAAAAIEHERETLARRITGEIGKPIRYARGEADRTAALLRAVARRASRASLEVDAEEAIVRRRPLGTIAIISPWNNPLAIAAGQIAPALAFGNSVIWKPTPHAPRTASELHRLLLAGGIEPDTFHLLRGDDEASFALLSQPEIDAVCFTGSTRTGRVVAGLCGERFLPLQAELGGNNAVVVMPDTDLARAARLIAEAAFGCAGQRCTATRRVIVDRTVYGEFLALLVGETAALRCGDPSDDATQVGPMLGVAQADRIRAYVERARRDGHGIVAPSGGAQTGTDHPAYHPPTIVTCDDPGAEIVQTETFGPLLVVQIADGFDDAMTLADDVGHGLVSALFSDDPHRRRRFLATARTGLVKLDQATVEAGVDVPFGGWKASGIGTPQHGSANLEFFTRAQAVYGDTAV